MDHLLVAFLFVGLSIQLPQRPGIIGRGDLSHVRGHDIQLVRRSIDTTTTWSAWGSYPASSNVPSPSGFANVSPSRSGAATISPSQSGSATISPSRSGSVTISPSRSATLSNSPSAKPTPGNVIVNTDRSAYDFPVTIEGQSFYLELDTGSSDTWVPVSDFQCYNSYNATKKTFDQPLSQGQCGPAQTYNPGSGFDAQDGNYLFQCYGGSSRCVRGPLGYTTVKIGDITVKQQVGAIKQLSRKTKFPRIESGLLGLARKPLTAGYDSKNNAFDYNPIMQTLLDSNTVKAKQFSLALSRDNAGTGNGGIFTIGGIPNKNAPEVNVSTNYFSSEPFVADRGFYTIQPEGFFIGGTVDTSKGNLKIAIDSGANIFEVPFDMAEKINSFWNPRPSSTVDGTAYVDCNAKYTVNFGINIGGRTFYMNPQVDAITRDAGSGRCRSLIKGKAADSSHFLVGDPFLKNVLAVFDWDKDLLSFYPRQHYLS